MLFISFHCLRFSFLFHIIRTCYSLIPCSVAHSLGRSVGRSVARSLAHTNTNIFIYCVYCVSYENSPHTLFQLQNESKREFPNGCMYIFPIWMCICTCCTQAKRGEAKQSKAMWLCAIALSANAYTNQILHGFSHFNVIVNGFMICFEDLASVAVTEYVLMDG